MGAIDYCIQARSRTRPRRTSATASVSALQRSHSSSSFTSQSTTASLRSHQPRTKRRTQLFNRHRPAHPSSPSSPLRSPASLATTTTDCANSLQDEPPLQSISDITSPPIPQPEADRTTPSASDPTLQHASLPPTRSEDSVRPVAVRHQEPTVLNTQKIQRTARHANKLPDDYGAEPYTQPSVPCVPVLGVQRTCDRSIEPHYPQPGVSVEAGGMVSDRFVCFTVPDHWTALRVPDGFHLTSGPCTGFVKATLASCASDTLCDPSDLGVLEKINVTASPVVLVEGPSVGVLAVDYRNTNDSVGRGIALIDREVDESVSVVIGLSGPSRFAGMLAKAERKLIESAYVREVPLGLHSGLESHAGRSQASSNICTIM